MFITFEGPDGSGKSTAIEKLAKKLESLNIDFVLTREPGAPSSKESASIREIIVNKDNNIPPLTEALLFAADRRMHLDNVILPSLKKGKIVLCDRYIDSSLAYQGAGRELGINNIKNINDIATNGKYPDLTIFFDILPSASEKRVDDRAPKDRMELLGRDFHEKVYKGYKEIIDMFKERYEVVDASQSREKVYEDVEKIVLAKINK